MQSRHGFLLVAMAMAAQATTFTDHGDGYCLLNKELARNLGQHGCWTAAQADPACIHPAHVSYGKGSRAGRCLCDTVQGCEMAGAALGADGYDRVSPPDTTLYPTAEGDLPHASRPFVFDDPKHGMCAQFYELEPVHPHYPDGKDCWDAVQLQPQCVNKEVVSHGIGTRAGRCLCDTKENCVMTGLSLGANGFERIRPRTTTQPSVSPSQTEFPTDAPTATPTNIGETHDPTQAPTEQPTTNIVEARVGFCANHKELSGAKNLGDRMCWEIAQLDSECVHPAEVSYGNLAGIRAGRCLCDTVGNCELIGASLGVNGFHRISPPDATHWPTYVPTDAPTWEMEDVPGSSGGFCPAFHELGSDQTERQCWASAQVEDLCANKEVVSYGLGHRGGRCLCDTIADCATAPGLSGQGLGEHGFIRIRHPVTESPTDVPTARNTDAPTKALTNGPTTAVEAAALTSLQGDVIMSHGAPTLIVTAVADSTPDSYTFEVSAQQCSSLDPDWETAFKNEVATAFGVQPSQVSISVSCVDAPARRAKKLVGTATVQVTITTSSSSVHGDPFVSYAGKKVQLYLPLNGKFTKLMKCKQGDKDVSLYGHVMTKGSTTKQWFDMFRVDIGGTLVDVAISGNASVPSNDNSASVPVKNSPDSLTKSPLPRGLNDYLNQASVKNALSKVRKAESMISKIGRTEPELAAGILNISIEVTGDEMRSDQSAPIHMVPFGSLPTMDGVTSATFKKGDSARHERFEMETPDLSLTIEPAVHRFENKQTISSFLHLDLSFNKVNANTCEGVLIEIWGLRPMRPQTAKMLIPPDVEN